MKCPTLSELPDPPANKCGWPWTEPSPPEPLAEGNLPAISISLPNFNYGEYIEATLRSILLQGYPRIELIVHDGQSSDNSVEIIQQYEPWISFWTSEPDSGQSHAINKGLKRAQGDIVAYLNSDDMYTPGAFWQVAKVFQGDPELHWIGAPCQMVNSEGEYTELLEVSPFRDRRHFVEGLWFPQPSVFWRRSVMERVGYFDEQLHYNMDQEYWARLACAGYEPHICARPLGIHRAHEESKTGSDDSRKLVLEKIEIAERYLEQLTPQEQRELRTVIRNHRRYLHRVECQRDSSSKASALAKLFTGILSDPRHITDRAFWGLVRSIASQ